MRHHGAMAASISTYPSPGRRRYVLSLILAGGVCMFLAPGVQAARIPFPNRKVTYELQRESLKDLLQRFFDDLSMPVSISRAVQQESGTLNGPRQGSAGEVFKSIADSNGLIGYFDGSVAYIYESREISRRYFQIETDRVNAFREATIGFGLTDGYDSLQINADTGSVTASGTPRFLEQLRQLGSAFAPRASQAAMIEQSPAVRMTLRFFPLKYAWAADTTFSVGEQRTVVPGVATILRQLVSPTDAATLGSDGGGNSPALNGLRGKGLAALGERLAKAGSPAGSTPMADYSVGATSGGHGAGPSTT